MAKHVSDVALSYNIIDTKDINDSKMAHAKDITQKILQDDIKGKTIGVAIEWIESLQNPHLKNYYKEAIKTYKELGAYVKNIQITNLEAALPCYYVISAAEAASNLARFDGMRYGYRSSKENKDIYKANRSESFGNEVKRRILLGNFVLSSGSENKYYQKARKVRALIQENYLSILKNVDAILAPATTGTAFEPGTQSVIEAYENDKFTVGVNLSGLPSLALPIGFDDGMPIGMQLIGKHMSDNLLLNLGHAFQKRTTWHKVSPVTL
jgi:aspartyl-tRNA(Asn)/glutamyl-tRNA(Gln) amidotransferase subunit A